MTSNSTSATSGLPSWARLLILVVVIGAVVATFVLRDNGTGGEAVADLAETSTGLPRLVDLGADKCIPCKAMAPILEELKTEMAGRMEVVFIDVWKKPAEADKYDVQSIPTQVFFGADGTELFRHVGFFGRDDILSTWARFGYTFDGEQAGG